MSIWSSFVLLELLRWRSDPCYVVQHLGKVASPTNGSCGPAVELLSALLLHHSPVVRRYAITAAVTCCKRSIPLGTSILASLQMWLREGAPQAILQDTSADDSAPSPSATAQRCHRAVASLAQALTSSDRLPSAAFYSRLLLLATHPLVTIGVAYGSSWAFISRCLAFSFMLHLKVSSSLCHWSASFPTLFTHLEE